MLESYGNKLDDEEKDAYYLQRIEHGLFVLQLIDLIMLEIAADGSDVVSVLVTLASTARAAAAPVYTHFLIIT